MAKKNNSALGIFMESIGLYFSNIDKFIKYMTFPVLGQIAGLFLVLLLTLFYTRNIPNLMQKIPALNDFSILMLIAILIALPGLAIFMKAFWEYLVAYGAVNSMVENMLKSGKVYDFDAHTELIKRRAISFVGLWFLFGIFSLIAVIPFFWVPCAVLTIYFVLVFQVFTFDADLSPIDCVKKSFQLVKGNFLSTFMLFALIGALTYVLIPQLINMFFDYTHLTKFFAKAIMPIFAELPISEINAVLTQAFVKPITAEGITLSLVSITVAQIFIQYTLPMRSILWSIWYKKLNGGINNSLDKIEKESKPRKKGHKKPSEKLMESSRKKFSSKKIDKNILRRAMEKED